MIAAIAAAILALAATPAAAQQKCTVSGYMTDAASGESLISAALLDQLRQAGMGAEMETEKHSDGLDVTIHIRTR